MSEDNKNYYEILEVSPLADPQEIHRAYIQVKNAYTTDSIALYSLMSAEECARIVENIEEAYSILSDPEKRIRYNTARGLVNPPTRQERFQQEAMQRENDSTQTKLAGNTDGKNIGKIIANKRFNLDYSVDPNFEQEIEKTSHYNGEFLKKIREYKNVDINRMAEMTKISKTYIQKIEQEDVTNLPALVYVRGFVYQYAKCLKLNPDLVATSYLEHLKSINHTN
ncbi:MAG: hypothetical protein A2381_03295 [Bdellovibrionales bacterium RIFOXYB1_FULL_37_110]|nr:MAG: hypothetical protein A2181_00400 [Bdellovibrionales bacterium RIFOXYA1_FULL_38_20]OFZ48430.1 MAG: hypothetical protein A2417_03785 [Bdellovibrionales bacterium RIFOXYC1_FULL_37_79]OFZ55431.1 MAG: hypothetical protein A2328_11560 [Bdellovibrionales bacterium RIFOXYB2_FULL_36_6]OFZ57951.1 MAG: hypothetical protein A2381_03295 [Bdellovibrionales bacterium RIFOXYB1_FULL_37_110]OFZ63088.1 MAG: hypothetical protein A2577_15425 [Bdellovibrionales bacterium RIFOXYD1_FULL_36_51]